MPMIQPINPGETKTRITTGSNEQIASQNALLELLKLGAQTTTTGSTTTTPIFANPDQSARLIDLVTNAIASGTQNIADLGNFTSSKTYQDALKGMMEGLRPGTEQGYQDLADAARIAGGSSGLRSGAYATSLGRYAADRGRYANEMAGKLVGELLPSYVHANTAALGQAAPLLNAQKGEQTISTQTQETSNPMAPKLSALQKKSLQWLGV